MSTKRKKKTDVATKCLGCGEPLRKGARFCGTCGTRVGATDSPSTVATQDVIAGEKSDRPIVPPLDETIQQATITALPASTTIPRGVGGVMGIMTGTGLGEQPSFSSSQRTAERADRVATVAKWSGAVRQLQVDKNPAGFSGTVREILDMIEPFTTERDQFQNIMFMNLLNMAQKQDLLPAINAAAALLPERFKPIIADPSRVSSLDTGGPWKDIFESWSYSAFQSCWDIPDDQLSAVCIQTIYEGAFLFNLAPNGYLEDEEARIQGGLYPSSFKPIVQRAYAKCHGVDTEDWGDSADQRADNLIKTIAPFGHPKLYRQLQAKIATAGMAMPAPQEKLSDWELQHLHAFAKDQTYNRQEVLSMLINRWETLSNQVSRMDHTFQMMFMIQHFMLSQCLNIHSRRANPQHHKDYGNFLAQGGLIGVNMIPIIQQGLEEKKPHLMRCLWPEQESLFLLEYRVRRQLAVQAAQSPPPAPPAPMAKPTKGQKGSARPTPPPPPPGRGPGKFLANGGVYYPMLPDIPLTPDGAGVRQQAMDLTLDLLEMQSLGNKKESKLIMTKLRELVSTNLSAFGLKKKRYTEMVDSTFHQYLTHSLKLIEE